MRHGLCLRPASRPLKRRIAAVAFRRRRTRMSSTPPCWSTARQRWNSSPLIRRQTSSVCQCRPTLPALAQLGRELRAEVEAPATDPLEAENDAPLGPDRFNVAQAQAEHGYSQVAWWMTSAG